MENQNKQETKSHFLTSEFVPYEQALALKELGFEEEYLDFYDDNRELFYNHENKEKVHIGDSVKAPLYQQAFRWFREKYKLRNSITDFIDDEKGIEWDYEIAEIGTDLDERGNYKPLVDYSTDDETRKFKTYEEAELACLRKLIEIANKIKYSSSDVPTYYN